MKASQNRMMKHLCGITGSILEDICKAMNCPKPPAIEVLEDQFTPAGFNDPKLTETAVEVFR